MENETLISEDVRERRLGFVIEDAPMDCCGCARKRGPVVVPLLEYGDDVFGDVTEGLSAGQHTGWEAIEGYCDSCRSYYTYQRMFVVTEVVRTTTRVTQEVKR